jgi:hypothetical protein
VLAVEHVPLQEDVVMTKSPASQMIEQVSKGMSPRRAIVTEDKLAAVDPKLAKLRDKAVAQLRSVSDMLDQIGHGVTIRDIANQANKLASELTTLTDKLYHL